MPVHHNVLHQICVIYDGALHFDFKFEFITSLHSDVQDAILGGNEGLLMSYREQIQLPRARAFSPANARVVRKWLRFLVGRGADDDVCTEQIEFPQVFVLFIASVQL